jgi:nitrogenase-stabilizing/protective protein
VPTTDPLPRTCRDAEDYFRALDVDYDPRVLAVGRLHVLRLFGQELERIDAASPQPDPAARQRLYRAALEQAYQAIVTAGPLEHRVFKVLRDRAPGQFVPLAEVAIDPRPTHPREDGDGDE